MLTRAQFDRTQRLALRLAGIELVERHRELLRGRSRRRGIRNEAEMDSLLTAAEQGEARATQELLCLLTTRFTGFFRHPRHFDWAAEQALVAVRQRGQARLWSAGAATGEEPYSLAMALIEVFQRDNPPMQILATDVDAFAVAVAQRGEYTEPALAALTPERRARFFCGDCGTGGTPVCSGSHGQGARATAEALQHAGSTRFHLLRVAPPLRRLVEFRPLNLADATWPITGPFDVIFCRNVLMYLEARHRHAALERMAALLAPDGLLMLDPAEHLGEASRLFMPGADGVYSLRRELSLAGKRRTVPRKLKL